MVTPKVLVTGAAGLLGRAIVDELRTDHDLTGFDRRAGSAPIRWRVGDLCDRAAVAEAVRGQDAIVHVAAVPNIWSAPSEEIMRVNVLGVFALLEAAETAGVRRVVLCSSDSVVGFTVREGALQPPLHLPIDLDHPLRPTDAYALSKMLGEEIGRSFALRGKLEVVALRPVFIAFPEMYGEIRARAKSPSTYRGTPAGGGPCWHHVDPRDVAVAFRRALELRDVRFERFFVSAEVTLAPEPTLERLERVLGRLPEVRDPDLWRDNP